MKLLIRLFIPAFAIQTQPVQFVVAEDGENNTDIDEKKSEEKSEDTGTSAAVAIVVITTLVIISILFELFTEFLKEDTNEMNMPFINTIFSELTTLGFIGLLLFVITKLNFLTKLSLTYFGEKNELLETIEVLHMGLFLFIVVFLVLCIGLLRLGGAAQKEWREFEKGSHDLASSIQVYVLATESPTTWREKLSLTRYLAAQRAHRELIYLALRRRFVDYRSNHPNEEMAKKLAKEYQVNPDIHFPFNEYLTIISGEVMGSLIDLDFPTWVALEAILVTLLLICWQLGEYGELYVLLTSGYILVFMNAFVLTKIRNMRMLLTPAYLFKDAERLRRKREWRFRNNLPVLLSSVDEKTMLLQESDYQTTPEDMLPKYLDYLPNGGRHLNEHDLYKQQNKLLAGFGNGIIMAVMSTRLVFLLTAMHLSCFLMRSAVRIPQLYSSTFEIVLLYILFLLPSIIVPFMSVRIARDGLYAFNVEHMKTSRVIVKVMRLLKARQTLRTLRFVAEMKIHLKEDVRRKSVRIDPKILQQHIHNEELEAEGEENTVSPPLSPLAAYMTNNKQRTEAQKCEAERRDINTIFSLFDVDGSGSISRQEMSNLLLAITHDMEESHLNRLMHDLVEIGREHLVCQAQQELEEAKEDPKAEDEKYLKRRMSRRKSKAVKDYEDDEIPFEAFYTWCHQHIRENNIKNKEELIEEIFQMIDEDSSGFITVDEFISIFKTLGQSLDHDDVRELVYEIDRNNDGKIDLEEFTKMLQKHEI